MEETRNEIMNLFGIQLPDDSTSIYQRGTVWFWKDPIYSGKENNRQIDKGESTMRYSRYVVIVQNPSTVKNDISVVPISSTCSHQFDVPIAVQHISTETSNVFARVQYCFPVSPSCLERYVCTLSHKDMSLISFRLMQMYMQQSIVELIGMHLQDFYQFDQVLLDGTNNIMYDIPSANDISNNYSQDDSENQKDGNQEDDSIESRIGNSVIATASHDLTQSTIDFFSVTSCIDPMIDILLFVMNQEVISGPIIASKFELDNEYDIRSVLYTLLMYHVIKQVPNTDDYKVIVKDAKDFPLPLISKLDYYFMHVKKDDVAYRKFIKDASKIENYVDDGGINKQEQEPKKRGAKGTWTNERKVEFVEYYKENGFHGAADQYGITEQSAKRYFYLFKKELSELEESESTNVEVVDTWYDISAFIDPNQQTIPMYIQDLGVTIKSWYQSRNAYNTYRKSGRKHKASKETPKFYNGIYKAIVYSLFDLIGITQDPEDASVYSLFNNVKDKDYPYTMTIRFIGEFHGYMTPKTKIDNVTAKLRDKFGSYFGINHEWLPVLETRLNKVIGNVSYNTASLAKDIFGLIGQK